MEAPLFFTFRPFSSIILSNCFTSFPTFALFIIGRNLDEMASIRRQGKSWQAVIRRKGHPTISKMFPKKALAEAWARKTEEELSKKLHINTVAENTTVKVLLTQYKKEITPRKRSADTEGYRIETLIKSLGEATLDELSPQMVIDYIDDRLEKVSSDSVRKEINILSVAVNAGMALWGIQLPANPVHTAKSILKVTKTLTPGVKRDRRPTEKELEMLYGSLPGLMPQLVEFAVETAMRRGEIAKQRRKHRKGNILIIPETKTDKSREIPLSKKACEILDSLPESEDDKDDKNDTDDLIWGYAPSSISHMFNRVCKAHNILNLRFHDLRHEAASRMFEKGLQVAEVAKVTGQSFSTLQRYTHLKAEHIAEKLG